MTCRLEPEKKLEKPARLILVDANQQQEIPRPNQVFRQNSRYAMSTAETCNIIDNTIDSLRRSMALVAEKVGFYYDDNDSIYLTLRKAKSKSPICNVSKRSEPLFSDFRGTWKLYLRFSRI